MLKAYAPGLGRIDILSVDVEGWELEVLRGLTLAKYKPRVMIIENLFDLEEHRTYMAGEGYVLWRHLAPNDVYVRAFSLPKRLLDSFRKALDAGSRRFVLPGLTRRQV